MTRIPSREAVTPIDAIRHQRAKVVAEIPIRSNPSIVLIAPVVEIDRSESFDIQVPDARRIVADHRNSRPGSHPRGNRNIRGIVGLGHLWIHHRDPVRGCGHWQFRPVDVGDSCDFVFAREFLSWGYTRRDNNGANLWDHQRCDLHRGCRYFYRVAIAMTRANIKA